MSTISVILPVSSTHCKDFEEFFTKAVESVKKQKEYINELVLVHTDDEKLVNFIDNFNFEDLNVQRVINQSQDTDFQSQINPCRNFNLT